MSLPANFTVKQKLPTGASDPDLGDASNDVSGQRNKRAGYPELFRLNAFADTFSQQQAAL